MGRFLSHGFEKLPYRLGVGGVVINSSNKVFAGQRIDSNKSAWQMPQGGIDVGESPADALRRELAEEIGTNNLQIIHQSDRWFYYDLPKHLIPKIWNGKFRGQKQKWFVLKFIGEDAEINIKTDKPEFSDWKWMNRDELLLSIVLFKRELYKSIFEEFDSILS